MYLTTDTEIYGAKIVRIEGRNKQFNNNSWRLQQPIFNDEQKNLTKDQ